MQRKVFRIVLTFLFLINSIFIAHAEKSVNMEVVDFKIVINEKAFDVNNYVLMCDNRTYLPLRNIAELLNLYVVYDGENGLIKISDIGVINNTENSLELNHIKEKYVSADITGLKVKMNGYIKDLENSIVIVNDRAYLPVREIAELLGCGVDWNSANKTIIINKNEVNAYPIRLWFAVEDRNDEYLYGYIDENGTIKIPPQYTGAYEFSDGLAAVTNEDYSYGYINTDGETVIPHMYYRAGAFSNGIASVMKKDDSVCYITNNNNIIAEYNNAEIHSFHDGFGVVNSTDENDDYKNMYIDRYGNVAANFGKEPISDFEGGYAVVGEDDKRRVINTKFEVVFTGEEYEDYSLSNGYIIAKKHGKYGVVDVDNNILIDFQYDMIGSFNEGLFDCKTESGWGFIDINNNIIIPMQYQSVEPFNCNVALATREDKPDYICFIDKNGSCTGETLEPEFYYRETGGMLRVYENGKFAYFINSYGKRVEPKL